MYKKITTFESYSIWKKLMWKKIDTPYFNTTHTKKPPEHLPSATLLLQLHPGISKMDAP